MRHPLFAVSGTIVTAVARILQSFGSFCRAVGSWHDPDPEVTVPPELAETFQQILQVPAAYAFLTVCFCVVCVCVCVRVCLCLLW